MRQFVLAVLLFFIAISTALPAEEVVEPNPDEINPLFIPEPEEAAALPAPKGKGFSNLFEDASLTLRSIYYGRARSADNNNRPGNPPKDLNEIHVNAFGEGVDFRSGYAWDVIGFDITGQTNLGRGNGWSEVLYHVEPGNYDRSSAALGQAALKTKIGSPDLGFEARGGFTPISIGSIGTSGGLHSHGYRGFEGKFRAGRFLLGYGWADRFRNDWDDTYRDMTSSWGQNRYNEINAPRISYIHTLGGRYEFGPDRAGFLDLGLGEGRRYRKNAQTALSIPLDLGRVGVLTLTGYGMLAKYNPGGLFGKAETRNEYHASGSAQLKNGGWTLLAGLGHTRAPDSGEMQFRLTAWGNSDNRNFIQTWGQLDDFVWDGQNVLKLGAAYEIGRLVNLPGLSVGASYMYGWNTRNPGLGKSTGWEIDYRAEYAVQKGRLKGLAVGVYAGHLRYRDNAFYGKQDRNDVKVIMTYSRTLEGFLRQR